MLMLPAGCKVNGCAADSSNNMTTCGDASSSVFNSKASLSSGDKERPAGADADGGVSITEQGPFSFLLPESKDKNTTTGGSPEDDAMISAENDTKCMNKKSSGRDLADVKAGLQNEVSPPPPPPAAPAADASEKAKHVSLSPFAATEKCINADPADQMRNARGYSVLCSFVSLFGASPALNFEKYGKVAPGVPSVSHITFREIEGALLLKTGGPHRDVSEDLAASEKVFTALIEPLDGGGSKSKKKKGSDENENTWVERLRKILDERIWTAEWEECRFDYAAENVVGKKGEEGDEADFGADNPLREWMPTNSSDLGEPMEYENVAIADRMRMLLWLFHWQIDDNGDFLAWMKAEFRAKAARPLIQQCNIIGRDADGTGYVPMVDGEGGVRVFSCGYGSPRSKDWSLVASNTREVEALISRLERRYEPLQEGGAEIEDAEQGKADNVKEDNSDADTVSEAPELELDNVMCGVCNLGEHEDQLILCESEPGTIGCMVGCHTFCLNPPLKSIPDDEWYCAKCEARLRQQKLCVRLRSEVVGVCEEREQKMASRKKAAERKLQLHERRRAASVRYTLLAGDRKRRRKQVDYTGAAFDAAILNGIRRAEGKSERRYGSKDESTAAPVNTAVSRSARAAARAKATEKRHGAFNSMKSVDVLVRVNGDIVKHRDEKKAALAEAHFTYSDDDDDAYIESKEESDRGDYESVDDAYKQFVPAPKVNTALSRAERAKARAEATWNAAKADW